MKQRKEKVLLLASYCRDCTDDLPCIDCLKMCNIAEVEGIFDIKVVGGYDYLTDYKYDK